MHEMPLGRPALTPNPLAAAVPDPATVLIVEDDPVLRSTLAHNLTREEFPVLAAADGEAGLEQARRERAALDFVGLDVMLPGISGLQEEKHMLSSRVGSRVRQGMLALALTLGFAVSLQPVAAQETDPSGLTGQIVSDGSSTVGPMTQAVAEEFAALAPRVQTSVDISGTGGGFARFCQGETDIQNASRPIDEEEVAICAENGVDWYEFEVAFDGITVVTNPENTFLECLTTEQLNSIWHMDGIQAWADVNPDWPAETISLYGPGTDSGTFDYFVEAILGEDEIRQDFTPSEDDNVLVQGVSGDANALGYFGAAYYQENQDILRAVAIDNGDGNCVMPTPETIQDGTYAPLSRPLFVYVRADSLQRPEIAEFMRFYLTEAGALAPEVGYVASPAEIYTADMESLEAALAGSGAPDSAAMAATPEA